MSGGRAKPRLDLTRNETLVALVVVAFCVVTAIVQPNFLSLPTLFDLLRGSIVIGIFAIGVLLVLISGGIDVSFTAIAAFAMYTTTLTLTSLGSTSRGRSPFSCRSPSAPGSGC
jgi:simple sugar transport system permease protein